MFRRMRLRRRRLRYLLPGLLLAILLAAAGCSQTDQNTSRPDVYGNDGYMGLSNSNPNLPRTGSAWSYRKDEAFAEELLRPLAGIKRIRIVRTAGAGMHVHLVIDAALSREEADRLTEQAGAVLRDNFPRYRVTVGTSRS